MKQRRKEKVGLFYKSESGVFLTFHHPNRVQFQTMGCRVVAKVTTAVIVMTK